MAGGFRLIENVLDSDLPFSGRHEPVHSVAGPTPKDCSAKGGKNRNLILLDIRIGREHEGIDVLLARLHILKANARIHGCQIMRNCCWVHDVRSVQLMLQTLQVVAISFFQDDADLQ